MTYYSDHIHLDSHGHSRSSILIDDRHYRFKRIDEFLNNLKSFCYKDALVEENRLIISKNAEVWLNDPNKLATDRLIYNKTLDYPKGVSQITKINGIESLLSQAKFENYTFNQALTKEIESYGLAEVYPEFFGIEINFLTTNHFALVRGLITVEGVDSETFYNTRTIMK